MGIRDRLKRISSASFIKDVAKLSLGTFAGKAITVAALPILTRIYSPEDFALLALYMALVSTMSIASCLRYEVAIPLAENDDDATHLLITSIAFLILIVSLAMIVIWVFSSQISILIKKPSILSYLWLIPFGIAVAGIYSITQNYSVRARWFDKIARIRISQALVGNSTSLLFGFLGVAPFGLLFGNIINTSSGGFRLFNLILKKERNEIKKITRQKIIKTMFVYRRYPLYSVPESLFNTAANQVPIMLIAIYAGAEAGFFALAMQIIVLPSRLMGGAISQVYISRVPQALKDGNLKDFTRSIILRMAKLGVAPFLLIGVISPILVPHIFGGNWGRSGEIISWLIPWVVMQFIVSPVSMVLHVVGKQNEAMFIQAFGMILRIGTVILAIHFFPENIVEIFAISGAIFYILYFFLINKVVGQAGGMK